MNHVGVVIAAAPGIRASSVASVATVISTVSTFEAVCARICTRSYTCTILSIYRPGSDVITSAFFDDLASVLDPVAVLREPIFVDGDMNIRLDRPDDPHTVRLLDTFGCRGLVIHPTESTQDEGGTTDVVASRLSRDADADAAAAEPFVAAVDVGLSDHRLLRWSVAIARRLRGSAVLGVDSRQTTSAPRSRRGLCVSSTDGWISASTKWPCCTTPC